MSTLMMSHGRPLALGSVGLGALPLARSVVLVSVEGRVLWDGTHHSQMPEIGFLSAAAASDDSVLVGTDAGTVVRLRRDQPPDEVARQPGRWIEQVAASPTDGAFAYSSGRQVWLVGAGGQGHGPVEHPSGVTGLAFDPKGKRVAAAHVDGVSLHWIANPQLDPKRLVWKGSHIGVLWSPDGMFVVSALQDMTLHGWRLADGADMRMAGYPAKTRSLAWTPKGRWLVTSGAPPVVCWPFQGKDGPMGKVPLELPPFGPVLASVVASHPKRDVVAAGYQDGSVLLFRLEDLADIQVADAADAKVTGISFSCDGRVLGFVREDGSAGLLDLPL